MAVDVSTIPLEAGSEASAATSSTTTRVRMMPLLAVATLLLIGTLACFWPATRQGFLLYEDPLTISQNPMIQQGLSWSSVAWAFKSVVTANWQPLTSISHIIAWQLWDVDAGKHHLVNVCIHAINVLLVFLVLRRMTGSLWRSAFVAAMFGWHPMHVESVAWISERKDVLSAFFFLLTLGAYGEYARRKFEIRNSKFEANPNSEIPNSKFRGYLPCFIFYLLALVLFALGLMSKPNVVTLPFVLLLLDFWPLKRVSSVRCQGAESEAGLGTGLPITGCGVRTILIEKVPFLLLSIALCVVTVVEQKSHGSLPTLEMFPLSLRVENALISYVTYLAKFFWPGDMGVFYLFPHYIPVSQAVAAGAILILVSAMVALQALKRPYLAVGWFWFLGILVPTIGLVQTGVQSRADHHTYLAYIGVALMLAWGLPSLLGRLTRSPARTGSASSTSRAPAFSPGLLLVGMGAMAAVCACWIGARAQLGYWEDSITLLSHTVQITRANEAAHNMLGAALLQAGRPQEAVGEFQETLKIEPHYPSFRRLALNTLGMLSLQQRRVDEAVALLTEALALNTNAPGTHFNLGIAYSQNNEWDKAATEFELVARMPAGNDVELNDAELQNRLARALIRCHKPEEALKHCQELVANDPANPAFRFVLGSTCLLLNRPEDAITNLREAIRQAPKTPLYMNQLAAVLASCSDPRLRNGEEALALAQRACDLTHHRNAAFIDTLAMAYAEARRFPEAIDAGEEARAIALAVQDQRGVEMMDRKLELYRAREPYHEQPGR